ncbi:AAA family ATPase [Nocardia africana]|uniref:AAA family ATPase n=1 Tax=Nocardia africana TaxID=134964 RepID=A0ABW6NHU0_9NOCA
MSVENVGGLVDQRIELPDEPLVAFAGPNGSGKTKLLAAMIGHWINSIPTPRTDSTARAEIDVDLHEADRSALFRFQSEMGWGTEEIPEKATLVAVRSTLTGSRRESSPQSTVLSHFYDNPTFLQSVPSLNPIYLPAERRLLPTGASQIDLRQLADDVSIAQMQNSRAAVQNYGRLDDQEFEQFAKALCIASNLPKDADEVSQVPLSRIQWPEFQETVNELIHPKKLLPLTQGFPDKLRIMLPDGDTHEVPDLSSGERQALVIMSRVLRAGVGHSVVIIDEPDAYLHPNLSQRLVEALRHGTGDGGQLILATHSPAILDRVPPNSIFRLDYKNPARALAGEAELIDMYKTTGFKSSALTQSELLIVTEGELDDLVLKALFPKLARATIQRGNGRTNVITRIKHLLDWDMPALGIVDRDIAPPELVPEIAHRILVLPTADMEGAFLSDDSVMHLLIEHGFVKSEFSDYERLKAYRDDLFATKKENVIAEIAQFELRGSSGIRWPNSKGDKPLDRLREMASQTFNLSGVQIEEAIGVAADTWELNKNEPWSIVRGKYILGKFTSDCTQWTNGSGLLEAVARLQPKLTALRGVEAALDEILA